MAEENSIFGSSFVISDQIYPFYSYQFLSHFQCLPTSTVSQFSFYPKNNTELNLGFYGNTANSNIPSTNQE